jgi:predicted transcriptional regulator
MDNNSIAVELREKRKAKGITIVELAEKAGISQAQIARIERGEIKPTSQQIELMLRYL